MALLDWPSSSGPVGPTGEDESAPLRRHGSPVVEPFGLLRHGVERLAVQGAETESVNFLLWLSITALAGGAAVGGHLQPARVLFILLFLVLLLRGEVALAGTPVQRTSLAIGVLWVAWGFISLSWTADRVRGAAEILVVGLGFITVSVVLSVMRKNPGAVHAVRRGWVTAFILTLPIAVWELTTDHHLATSMGHTEAGGEFSTTFFYAGTTFGNRNNYSTFIVFVFPFLLWSLSRTRGLVLRLVYVALIASAAFRLLLQVPLN